MMEAWVMLIRPHACMGDVTYTNPLDFFHVCMRASQFTKEKDQPDFRTYSRLLDSLPTLRYTRGLVRLLVLGHIQAG